MSWTTGFDSNGREFVKRSDGYTEYKMDKNIARIILDKATGINGELQHSHRSLSIAVTGSECQHTGQELARIAAWTLDEETK